MKTLHLIATTLLATLTLSSCAGTGGSGQVNHSSQVIKALSEKSTPQEIAMALTGTWEGCMSARHSLTNDPVAPSFLTKVTAKYEARDKALVFTPTSTSATNYPDSKDCTGKAGETATQTAQELSSEEMPFDHIELGKVPLKEFDGGYLIIGNYGEDGGIFVSLDGKTMAMVDYIKTNKTLVGEIMKKQ